MAKSKALDQAVLEPETGIRAAWLLYKRGQWGALEDFGLDRKQAEPAFKLFEHDETVVSRPTKRQCRKLVSMVPGLADAGKELRLAYALKKYSEHKNKGAKGMTRYFHGEVKTELVYDSDARAVELAEQAGQTVRDLGGRLDVGRNFGDAPAILVIALPDDVEIPPSDLVKGVEFKQVHATTVQAVEDQGITGE